VRGRSNNGGGAHTRVQVVYLRLLNEIESGARSAGSKLLSIRKCASEYGVSKNTIVEAYDRLVASGHVLAKAGSGFVVAAQGETNQARPKHVSEAVDIASLLSAQLEETFDIRVGDGRPPPSWTEESEIKRHLGYSGRGNAAAVEAYGSAMGFLPLRHQIVRRLASQNIGATEKQILLTFGANHALDLVIRSFLAQGDTVLVDDPGYYPLFAKLKLAQVRVVGVRRLPDGPDAEDFASKVATERPKLFFTQSVGQNPTGSTTSLPVAHSILTIAAKHNVTIVEDDPFSDLSVNPPNRLATLDQLNRVVSIGTYSKTLSAGLRSGHIAASVDKITALTELKMLTTVNSSGHVERLLTRLCEEGHYDRHLKRLAQRVEAAAVRVYGALSRRGYSIFSGNGGGYYLYLMLPDGTDDIEFARLGAKESIFIAPGSVFSIDKSNSSSTGIRINVARADDERFLDFLLRKLS